MQYGEASISTAKTYKLKLQIMSGDEIAMGPGKADLLDNIIKTGSIAAAGRAMGMSYKRAWDLVEQMNSAFSAKLVETSKGGAGRGGAVVTPFGEDVLKGYRVAVARAAAAVEEDAAKIHALTESGQKLAESGTGPETD